MTEADPDPALDRVRKHVEAVRDFYFHLMTYVVVNTVLVIVDLTSGPGVGFLGLDFAHWPILFWGLGVAGHAIRVFFGDYRVQKLYEQEQGRASH